MTPEWTAYARTDRGRVRERNEDAYVLEPPVLLVADGLGGHPGGDDASRVGSHTAALVLSKEPPGEDALREAFLAADRAVRDEAEESARPGMGTTLVGGVVSVENGTLYLANVGDSRAYLLDDDALHLVTEDDNEAAEMVRRRLITRDAARTHPGRFWLSQALGIGTIEVRTQAQPLRGQRLLLCSDGLLELSEERVESVLRESGSPEEASGALVDAVLEGTAASDNVTVLVADLPAVD
ncbi:MAG: PP2C family protein-serine/threonine phosphatase [Actinomycetes bacterium]